VEVAARGGAVAEGRDGHAILAALNLNIFMRNAERVRGANIFDPVGHRFIVRGAVIAPGALTDPQGGFDAKELAGVKHDAKVLASMGVNTVRLDVSALAPAKQWAFVQFPRGLTRGRDLERHRFDFSFSGLKTEVARWVESREAAGEPVPVNDIAASFQEAVCDVLVRKAIDAALDSASRGALV